MNDESLSRVNDFLAAAASRTVVGDVMTMTPAEIGRDLGFPDALSTARAVRALIARRRLEAAQGSYRLLDATPVSPDEKEAIGRAPRRRRGSPGGAEPEPARGAPTGDLTYSDLGRAAVDRLIDIGRESASLRAGLRQAREDVREARRERDEAEHKARGLAERVHDLEARAEMAESNLRTLLASARANGEPQTSTTVSDHEMEAILGVLKGGEDLPVEDDPAQE
jgi:hypothetical protein